MINQVRLHCRRASWAEVREWMPRHRHLSCPPGHLVAFAVCSGEIGGALFGEWTHGIAVIGRPVSPKLQARGYLEITRCVTDGTPNACSALYGVCRRWARRTRPGSVLVTYTRSDEPGTSLRAAGYILEATSVNTSTRWANRPGRIKGDDIVKKRWRA